ncbi:MAG: class I SAM-dependent methyltransferase [Desulfovibrio sp.]|jgi:spermidine synthase|nr:class I SAM-dependent methyltransferase [Desulfovibrio sp.]
MFKITKKAIKKIVDLCGYVIMRKNIQNGINIYFPNFPSSLNDSLNYDAGIEEYNKIAISRLLLMSHMENMVCDQKVLELGGDGSLGLAKTVFNSTKKRVVVVNPYPNLYEGAMDEQKVEILQTNLEFADLGENEFDIIIGIAVTEHILNIKEVFETCYRILKPGGCLMLQGGPHWYSNMGHHLYVCSKNILYNFSDNNVIDDFSHLYLSPWEMRLALEDKHIPKLAIEAIIEQVYYDEKNNRKTTEEIIDEFKKLPWEKTVFEREIIQPSSDIRRKILIRHPDWKQCEFAYSLYITANKPFEKAGG